ncbi:DUF4347 domain-containing protein [Pantanalinema sp. GBBB05]|uniref:DUF4347 domain-containing protein n=1 Tax=Pantanalinema sp. GBBB05 TaxID=2604139 RepID=UPI001D33EEAE|nr:DUF4347 domain-containing protein [Pantanalinema sp. GBBB05]
MDFSTSSPAHQPLHSQPLLTSSIPNADAGITARSSLESLEPANGQLSRASSIVFIDSNVQDYQELIAGVQPGTEVYMLNPAQDAVAQITQTLLGRSGIASVHIVSHGEAGELQLGNTWLNSANLHSYRNDFQTWTSALTADADILLYGCNVAQGEVGRTFVQQLAQLTGADIAASQDWTGSTQLGGNWVLEVNTGEIAAALIFQASTIADYHHILPVELISTADPNLSPGDTAGAISGTVGDNGRYVVLTSSAGNLVANDMNSATDIFVRDLQTGTIQLVSANQTGTGSGNGASSMPNISRDGRYVVFASSANDLIANDTNNARDVFVRDLFTGTTTLVSANLAGTGSGNGISGIEYEYLRISNDNRYVVFTSSASDLVANDTNNAKDVFMRDLLTGTTILISVDLTGSTSANKASNNPSMSGDGRYIVFTSTASNLVAGDTNSSSDVFVRDRLTGTTMLVSANYTATGSGNRDSGSSDFPKISQDGRYVTFSSDASNLVANDLNGQRDVFRRDLVTGTTALVSVNYVGTGSGNLSTLGAAAMSEDGRYVAFKSNASDLVLSDTNRVIDVFVRDMVAGVTTLASVNQTGTGSGNGASGGYLDSRDFVRISGDGRYVVFNSEANNLVATDMNYSQDIFMRDLSTGVTTLISRTSSGSSANQKSSDTVISTDGQTIVFVSQADNLVSNDNNSMADVFAYRLTNGTVSLVSQRDPNILSVSGSGSSKPTSVSADGRYVVFTSNASNLVANDNNNSQDVFLWDRVTDSVTLVSQTSSGSSGNRISDSPTISSDGRYVAFTSYASNLVPNDNNSNGDVFLWERVTGNTTLVSRTSTGSSGNSTSASPAISSDGRYVAFTSSAGNLVLNDNNNAYDVFLWDRVTDSITLVSRTSTGSTGNSTSSSPRMSSDGRYVVFTSSASNLVPNDNSVQDVFLYDQVMDSITLVSRTSTGSSGNSTSASPTISSDGRYVVFESAASNLVPNAKNNTYYYDVFLWDRVTGSLTLVSRTSTGSSGFGNSYGATISSDGRYVAFTSSASNLAANDNGSEDVFLWDRVTGSITLVSRSSTGSSSYSSSGSARISEDGNFVAFSSSVSNLVANDSNGSTDVFVWNRQSNSMKLVSRSRDGGGGNQYSTSPIISSNGSYLVFTSAADNLVGGDLNGIEDVFGIALDSPEISINSVSQAEGRDALTAYTFTVTLANASDRAITVQYTTADGTATTADNDYVAASGSLTFNPGETTKTITIYVKGDRRPETDETFRLRLFNPTNAEIALNAGTVIGTITNDDKLIGPDFNSDGKVDLLWRNTQTGQLGIWLLNGTQYDRVVSLPVVSDLNWKMEATADFDGDGDLDLLWRHAVTGQTGLWILNGTSFERSIALPDVPDLNWQIEETADFNGDGKVDLLWRNTQTGQLGIWLLNGTQYDRAVSLPVVSDLNWKMEAIADFDGDGDLDLLWRHAVTGQTGLWILNGTSFERSIALPDVPDLNWQIEETADFNGDGKVDLLWRNTQTGQLGIWLLNGTQYDRAVSLPVVSDLNWKMEATADFDGDGDLDLLWRHAVTGQTGLWILNGTSFERSIALPDVPDLNWQIEELK